MNIEYKQFENKILIYITENINKKNIERYYGLKVCVPPKLLCWNPKLQGDGVRRWRPSKGDEVMRVEPHEGLVSL